VVTTVQNLSRLLTNPEIFIQPVSQEVLENESDEPELILESHLQIGLSLSNSLELLQGQVDSASLLVEHDLDAVRNKLLFANMCLTIITVCLSAASLVGTFLGMNVINGLETAHHAFREIVTVTMLTTFIFGILTILFLIYNGAIPRYGLTKNDTVFMLS
jgi:Mg2+ and Co2+ transporter CorA